MDKIELLRILQDQTDCKNCISWDADGRYCFASTAVHCVKAKQIDALYNQPKRACQLYHPALLGAKDQDRKNREEIAKTICGYGNRCAFGGHCFEPSPFENLCPSAIKADQIIALLVGEIGVKK